MSHAVIPQTPLQSSQAEKPWLDVYGSRSLPDWLVRQGLSLAFSTYQSGKLFFIAPLRCAGVCPAHGSVHFLP